jgi:hypothetical protein
LVIPQSRFSYDPSLREHCSGGCVSRKSVAAVMAEGAACGIFFCCRSNDSTLQRITTAKRIAYYPQFAGFALRFFFE